MAHITQLQGVFSFENSEGQDVVVVVQARFAPPTLDDPGLFYDEEILSVNGWALDSMSFDEQAEVQRAYNDAMWDGTIAWDEHEEDDD